MIVECQSLEEVREQIDRLDREIVQLLGERSEYVRLAAAFKKTTDDVRAPKRAEEVISKVRGLAMERHVSPDIVEAIYRTMITAFVDYEMREHNKRPNE